MNISELKSVMIGMLLTVVIFLSIGATSGVSSGGRYQYIGKEEVQGANANAVKDMEIVFDSQTGKLIKFPVKKINFKMIKFDRKTGKMPKRNVIDFPGGKAFWDEVEIKNN